MNRTASLRKWIPQYKANLALAGPVVLSQIGQVIVQLSDNLMVARLGALPLAAVSFGGAVFTIFLFWGTGLSLGLTPLTGEAYAQRKIRTTAGLLQNALVLYSLVGLLLFGVLWMLGDLLEYMGQSPEVVRLAVPYYRYLAWSIIPYMVYLSFKQFLEGVGNTRTGMAVVLIANAINIVFNYLLIFGKGGFPELGAAGAGLSTLISRICMPLFMLAGELMNTGGITQRIINFCMELLRPIRGGLGEVNIVASMIFGGISGSSVADTSALGSILIPAMEKEGYPPEASAGITVASSTMGMIIPPSTPMIVYSMISGASVGALFVAGAVPGILIGLTQLVLVYIISAKKGWHPEKVKFDGKRAAKSLLSGIPALIMPLFIIICVSFGVCTASESAGVAVLYSMLVGFFVYKELTWKGVWEALKKTLISSSSIMLIIGFTTIFTWVLTMQKVPQTVGAFFMSLNMPAWAIALIFDVLILMIGTFIDVSPAILLLTPILLPVMVQYGFSPLQFGAMMITGLAIGLVTPPVGMCLNACNKINRMPIIEIFKGAAPYVICNVIVLISISLWGPLTTALPQLLGYSIF